MFFFNKLFQKRASQLLIVSSGKQNFHTKPDMYITETETSWQSYS